MDALDSVERERLDSHVETCDVCSLTLQEEGETIVRLAFAVPQRQVPPAVKPRLLSRIDAGTPVVSLSGLAAGLGRAVSSVWRALAPHTAKAVTSFMVIGLIVSGIWFNGRLNDISSSNEELVGEIESVAEGEAEVRTMIASQRYLSFVTDAPGMSVNVLRGTKQAADAWGTIMCCALSDGGAIALLGVFNLPPLPPGQVYHVWLVKNGQRHSGGQFTVDSTGYGHTVIVPQAILPEFDPVNMYVPFTEFDAIGITVEPAGTAVLQGDL
ncbi:MAG: anti-sigma factor [Chloroflexi bacterium]|nr:anti-sigma factor [Chloroflexota bacterium]